MIGRSVLSLLLFGQCWVMGAGCWTHVLFKTDKTDVLYLCHLPVSCRVASNASIKDGNSKP